MRPKTCKNCGVLVSKGAKNCPQCGIKIKTSMFVWVVLGIFAVVFFNSVIKSSYRHQKLSEVPSHKPIEHKPVTRKPTKSPEEPRTEGVDIRHQNISMTDLQISFTHKQIGKGTVFYGETNLPGGTKLGISLEKNGKNCGQDFDIYVAGGTFKSRHFTSHGYPLSGTYNVELFTLFNRLWQGKDILILLEHYDSKKITVGEMGWKKLAINQTITFVAQDAAEQQEYIKKRENELVEMVFYLQKLESFFTELMDMKTLQQFNEMIMDWNIRLGEARDEFDSKYEDGTGRYKGYCYQAYTYISLGYGTLASQNWLAKKSFLEGRKPDTKMLQSNTQVEEYISTARQQLKSCMNEINN